MEKDIEELLNQIMPDIKDKDMLLRDDTPSRTIWDAIKKSGIYRKINLWQK